MPFDTTKLRQPTITVLPSTPPGRLREIMADAIL